MIGQKPDPLTEESTDGNQNASSDPPLASPRARLLTYEERMLMRLGPKDPHRHTVDADQYSTVKIFMVKDGLYLGQKVKLVLLDIELASTHITRVAFHILLRGVTGAASDNGTNGSNPVGDSTSSASVSSPKASQHEDERAKLGFDQATFYRLLSSARSRASSLASSFLHKDLEDPELNPPLGSLAALATAPYSIEAPTLDVAQHRNMEAELEPEVDAGVGGGKVGRLGFSTGQDRKSTPGGTLVTRAMAFGLTIRAHRADVAGGGCPRLFRVGFIVESPDDRQVEISIRRAPVKMSKKLKWVEAYPKLLVDTTLNGTRPSSVTCGKGVNGGECCERCPDLTAEHFTEQKWKALLLQGDVRSFNRLANSGNWVHHVWA